MEVAADGTKQPGVSFDRPQRNSSMTEITFITKSHYAMNLTNNLHEAR